MLFPSSFSDATLQKAHKKACGNTAHDRKSFCFEEEYSCPSRVGRHTHMSLLGSKLKDQIVTAGPVGQKARMDSPIWAKRTEVTGKTETD